MQKRLTASFLETLCTKLSVKYELEKKKNENNKRSF